MGHSGELPAARSQRLRRERHGGRHRPGASAPRPGRLRTRHGPGQSRAGRKYHDAIRHASELVAVLRRRAAAGGVERCTALREAGWATRVQWQVEGRAALLRTENDILRERIETLEAERDRSQGETNAAHELLMALKATRRYRAGAALAAPVDKLRESRVRVPRPHASGAPTPPGPDSRSGGFSRRATDICPGLLENLEEQVDGLVALDDGSVDGSAELVREDPLTVKDDFATSGSAGRVDGNSAQTGCLESRPTSAWSAVFENGRSRRSDARNGAGMTRSGYTCGSCGTPPIAGALTIWGGKGKPVLFRSDPAHRFDERRVYAVWPSYPPRLADWPRSDLILYHMRMIDPADRAERVEKFRRIDPECVWQPSGCDYLSMRPTSSCAASSRVGLHTAALTETNRSARRLVVRALSRTGHHRKRS